MTWNVFTNTSSSTLCKARTQYFQNEVLGLELYCLTRYKRRKRQRMWTEHAVTLYLSSQEYREVAEEAGITNFKRVPALNSDPDFIKALADMTVDALEKPVCSFLCTSFMPLFARERVCLVKHCCSCAFSSSRFCTGTGTAYHIIKPRLLLRGARMCSPCA
jgi:hypothetical protein